MESDEERSLISIASKGAFDLIGRKASAISLWGYNVKYLIVALVCVVACEARAESFELKAASGIKTRVHVYKAWKTDCSPNVGVVKLLSKPEHGRLETSAIDTTITMSRHNPQLTRHCIGKPVLGFQVDYTSNPGFRGVDQFKIEAIWGRDTEIDTYTIKVN